MGWGGGGGGGGRGGGGGDKKEGGGRGAEIQYWENPYHYLWIKEMFALKCFVTNFLFMCFFVHNVWRFTKRRFTRTTNILSFQLWS